MTRLSSRSLPLIVLMAGGLILSACVGGPAGLGGEPPLTRFLAEQLCTPHWYSMEPARRDFGYVPQVSIEEGLRRLKASSAA